jgi:hypothetical protein
MAGVKTVPSENGSGARGGEREMTYYTAKQAYGHLVCYLRSRNSALPIGLSHVLPERSAIYAYDERLADIIGGWLIEFSDAKGRIWEARLNCWGDTSLTPVSEEGRNRSSVTVAPAEWVLDNVDAHRVALSRGAVGSPSSCGGSLMALRVKGRGVRPVWAGGAWRLPGRGLIIAVDAHSGEVYRFADDRSLELLDGDASTVSDDWDGGFAPKSSEALFARYDHPYWWPNAYQDAGGRYVYNRSALLAKITEEQQKVERKPSSWFATGIAAAVLGRWDSAARDLDEAVKLAPEDSDFRFARGLVRLAIRDLDGATKDFAASPGDASRVGDSVQHLEMLRGARSRGGLLGFMHNLETDFGFLPIELRIGPEFLNKE